MGVVSLRPARNFRILCDVEGVSFTDAAEKPLSVNVSQLLTNVNLT